MKITGEDLGKLRGLIYEIGKNGNTWNPTLLRRALDQLKLDLSFLEEPHPNDESLRNALTMLFMAFVDGDDGFIPKDRQLYRDAMRHLKQVLTRYSREDIS